jgi:hypothetical protein
MTEWPGVGVRATAPTMAGHSSAVGQKFGRSGETHERYAEGVEERLSTVGVR